MINSLILTFYSINTSKLNFIDSVQQILVFDSLISIFINFLKCVASNFIHYEISLIYLFIISFDEKYFNI